MALALHHTHPVSRPVRAKAPHLRLVPSPAPIQLPKVSAATYRRRRLVAMAAIALVGALAFGALSGTQAEAGSTVRLPMHHGSSLHNTVTRCGQLPVVLLQKATSPSSSNNL